MTLVEAVVWMQKKIKQCLVDHRGVPPWELGIKPDVVKRVGNTLRKEWNNGWFWEEELPPRKS